MCPLRLSTPKPGVKAGAVHLMRICTHCQVSRSGLCPDCGGECSRGMPCEVAFQECAKVKGGKGCDSTLAVLCTGGMRNREQRCEHEHGVALWHVPSETVRAVVGNQSTGASRSFAR